MKEIVKLTQRYVLSECKKKKNIFGMNAYNYHFKSVVFYAKKLAETRKADLEIVLLSAWLHDIGSICGDYENHHVVGQDIAEKFLLKHGYSKEKTERIKHCIYAHRSSKKIKRETVEAECISDADSMSHFDNVPSLFFLAIDIRGLDAEEAGRFVKEKLKGDFNKLTPFGKKLIKKRYLVAMEIF